MLPPQLRKLSVFALAMWVIYLCLPLQSFVDPILADERQLAQQQNSMFGAAHVRNVHELVSGLLHEPYHSRTRRCRRPRRRLRSCRAAV
jgi:hypothetical protein